MHRGATVGGGDGLAALEAAKAALQATPRRWAITGVAGFIGSHLLEDLLLLDQEVVGLDDLSTGRPANLAEVRQRVGEARWARFRFEVGDIRDRAACARLCAGAAGVFHEAAVVSVPRSIEDPLLTFEVNVGGFLNVLQAALDAGVPRVVYASSSAVYGDSQRQPNREGEEGRPLSPYGLSKRMDEEAAALFHGLYGLSAIGLRYFNIFGPRQDPAGAHAAVIPKWIEALLAEQACEVFGDGSSTRDFCFVKNVVDANLRAALAPAEHPPRAYNVAHGQATSLRQLFSHLAAGLRARRPEFQVRPLRHAAPRPGDILHSAADLQLLRRELDFLPRYSLVQGLEATLDWYLPQART